MKTTIYYFSGTGNSLYVAKEVKKEIENSSLVPISKELSNDHVIASDRVGFVFPLHGLGLPVILPKFLKILDLSKTEYLFAIVSRGAKESWGALNSLNKLLKKKRKTLSAGFYVNMPVNYIIKHNVISHKRQKELFNEADKKINTIIDTIKEHKKTVEYENFKARLISTIYHSLFYRFINLSDINFYAQNNCSSCGICEQVCPSNNITLENGKPKWHHRCFRCLACINLCPEACIQHGKKTISRQRYHHPDISVKELSRQK